jgi:hypothetical protein
MEGLGLLHGDRRSTDPYGHGFIHAHANPNPNAHPNRDGHADPDALADANRNPGP